MVCARQDQHRFQHFDSSRYHGLESPEGANCQSRLAEKNKEELTPGQGPTGSFGTDRVRVLEKTSGSGSGTDRVRVLALHFYQSGIIGY